MNYSLSLKYMPINDDRDLRYSQVDEVLELIQKSGLEYKIGASETTILGEFEELNNLFVKINKLAVSHDNFTFLILANYTVSKGTQSFESKLDKYE